MKKIYTFLFIIGLLSSVINAFAQNAPITSISSATTCPSTVITLTVTQTNLAALSGIGLRIDYDASVLSFIDPNPLQLPGNFNNTNTALYAAGGPFTSVQTSEGANLKKLGIYWTSTGGGAFIPSDVAGVATLMTLSFWYYGGNTSVIFNTTALFGQACEWIGANALNLNDVPAASYYNDGTITQDNPPSQPSIITGNATPCEGSSEYSVVSVYGVDYTWTNTANFTGTSTVNSITYTVDGTSIPGIITVAPSNTCGIGTPTSLEITNIRATSIAATSASVSANNICSGATTTLSSTGGTLGYNALWNWYSTACGTTYEGQGVTFNVAPTAQTTYFVRAEGLCNTTTCASIEILIKPVPTIASIAGNTKTLIGTTQVYTVPTDANVSSYAWTIPSGWSGTSTTTSITCIAGYYSGNIVVTPSNNCGAGVPKSIYISAVYNVSGYFTYNNIAATPIDSLWVYALQNTTKIDSTQADINGYYMLQIPNGTYNVTATTHKPWMGVNVTDGIKVKRHFSGAELFTSSYRIHAGDVNLSYAVSIYDAVLIQRRFAGSDTTFVRGDWNFEKIYGGDTINVSLYLNDTVIVNGSDVSQDFKGVVIGDVNGSYPLVPGAKSSPKLTMNNNGTKYINSNQYFELPIKVNGNLSVGAMSLILNYPKELVTISNIQLVNNSNIEDLAFNTKGNELRIGWLETNGAINMDENTYIIVKLKTNNTFKAGDVINFDIANNMLCEFADYNGDVYNNVDLNTYSIKHISSSGIADINYINSIEVYPNPAKDMIKIEYNLANDGLINISIFNVLGEKVTDIINNSQIKGSYNSNVDLSKLNTGVYTIKMTVDGNVIVKRIVITK